MTDEVPKGGDVSTTDASSREPKSVASSTPNGGGSGTEIARGENANRRSSPGYMRQRRWLGLLAIALPFVLLAGGRVLGEDPQPSISSYYDTKMVGVFVAVSFAIGFFLVAYAGGPQTQTVRMYERADWVTTVAGAAAIVVALAPTTSEVGIVKGIHLFAAVLMFALLAYISLVLFPKTDTGESEKRGLELVYRIGGGVILVSMAMIGIYSLIVENPDVRDVFLGAEPVFWLEAVALIAFAVAWLTKGNIKQAAQVSVADLTSKFDGKRK